MAKLIVALMIVAVLSVWSTEAKAGCTTYMMPDGSIVTMCCSPDGRMCQIN